jgi:hypothetical protein
MVSDNQQAPTVEWIGSADGWSRCRIDDDQLIAETWAYGDSMTGSHSVNFDLTPAFVAALRSQLDMWEQQHSIKPTDASAPTTPL